MFQMEIPEAEKYNSQSAGEEFLRDSVPNMGQVFQPTMPANCTLGGNLKALGAWEAPGASEPQQWSCLDERHKGS